MLHQEQIDLAWKTSAGTSAYLGEWHTHPEDIPSPSFIDLMGWQKKLVFDRIGPDIFFVIVGTAEVRAWEGRLFRNPDSLEKWTPR
jgi:integrative and conjugative element protein (TIGR02256 family)